MIDKTVLSKHNGILVSGSGVVIEEHMRYDAVFTLSIADGNVVCKKILKSLTAAGFGQHEHTIVPQTVRNLIDFFGAAGPALTLYRQLPQALLQPIREAIPHAFDDQDP